MEDIYFNYTKATMLIYLKEKLELSKIEDILTFSVNDFRKNSKKCVMLVKKTFQDDKIIIRSSAKGEDTVFSSNAGHYSSVLDVKANNETEIIRGINAVISSYCDIINLDNEEILIQRQAQNIVLCGVVFTIDPKNGKPYYVINYDDNGSTNSVTSGISNKKIYISNDVSEVEIPVKWKKLIKSIKEIQSVIKNIPLDIEFAINSSNDIIIFQVRPLVVNDKYNTEMNTNIFNSKKEIVKKYNSYKRNFIFSDMAFWNPAEIIGNNPKQLDYSLYEYIITNREWNTGIKELGYTDINKPIMYKFANKPYINVDYAFKALIPSNINNKISKKLIQYYNKKLLLDLSSHDKIEFEIIFSCYDFSIDKHMNELKKNGFSEEEINVIRHSLYDITVNIIKNYANIIKKDLKDLNKLETYYEKVLNDIDDINVPDRLVLEIEKLLNAIKRYSTPQFSRQARCAFISKSLLQSLLSEKLINKLQYDNFMSNIETIATQFYRDYEKYKNGNISKENFLHKYGHLRAGTYNILSKRYDQLNIFEINSVPNLIEIKEHAYEKNNSIKVNIEEALKEKFFNDVSYDDFINFVKKSIQYREYFKFTFTKSLSLVLEIIKKLCKKINIKIEDITYVEIKDIISLKNDKNISILKNNIKKNKKEFNINSKLILPQVITSELSFDIIENCQSRPNFITEKIVKGEIAALDDFKNIDIENKIVFLEKADPGYDWIFTKNILGLITKYGGVASHMAIRCSEFGIPAAIGCGEELYNKLECKNSVLLNCKDEKVEELN